MPQSWTLLEPLRQSNSFGMIGVTVSRRDFSEIQVWHAPVESCGCVPAIPKKPAWLIATVLVSNYLC